MQQNITQKHVIYTDRQAIPYTYGITLTQVKRRKPRSSPTFSCSMGTSIRKDNRLRRTSTWKVVVRTQKWFGTET
jgi:hypothetical protein